MEGRSGGLLSGGDAHSVSKTVVSRGHCRWCPAYFEPEQALLNTTRVIRQHRSLLRIYRSVGDRKGLGQTVQPDLQICW